ncbi:unnamed protein product [Phytophthora fragariaefolia]|uniref:Unnamed protein product n=1 Tax=Phytophthora fragariaefolia TaxID=1490495 RepID=A0A9W6TSF3_9STRA|nr:unnamed protein product [Phytophthora fragariaefolia]
MKEDSAKTLNYESSHGTILRQQASLDGSRVVRLCDGYLEQFGQVQKRFFFQNGLREETAKKFKEENPNTLQEAIEIASNFEFAHYSGRPPRVPSKSFRPVPTESCHRANKSRPHKAKRFEKKSDTNDDWTKTCKNCGVVGHISPQCKAPKRKEANRYISGALYAILEAEAQAIKNVGQERPVHRLYRHWM